MLVTVKKKDNVIMFEGTKKIKNNVCSLLITTNKLFVIFCLFKRYDIVPLCSMILIANKVIFFSLFLLLVIANKSDLRLGHENAF